MKVEVAAFETKELLTDITSKRDPRGIKLTHAKWMLEGIAWGYVQGEKAHRWLGYAQAIVVVNGWTTLHYVKEINHNAK